MFSSAIGAGDSDVPRVTALEVVTTGAAPGDGGNGWGGHQCRIVRTPDGVFTAYTVPGKDDLSRGWRLAWRRDGQWKVVAQGLAGREPVNLLASPDGTLRLFGWPGGEARLWSGRPESGRVVMREEAVPGLGTGHWPYSSAGTDGGGRLFLLSSEGEKPGVFRWAVRDPRSGAWTGGATELDYRHCYTYVLLEPGGGVSLVATRDVLWETLGYTKPFDQFDYVFNAYGLWRSADLAQGPPRKLVAVEEKPTRRTPVVRCDAQGDAYLDNSGRVHILYRRLGPQTGEEPEVRYAVFTGDGTRLSDVKVPWDAGPYCRVFQDDRGRFYLLGSDGVLFGGDPGGVSFARKTKLKFRWHQVEDAGFGLAVPRTGTPPSNFIDGVFPSGGGEKWIYFRVLLHGGERGR